MTDILIRPPHAGDGEALARIWLDTASYYADLEPALFQVPSSDGLAQWCEDWASRTKTDDSLLLLAEYQGELVGFVTAAILQPMEHAERQFVRDVGLTRLSINALVVERAYWRLGIGTQLMESIEEWGRSKGAVIALLDTYADSPVSVPFYEAGLGYKRRAIYFRKVLLNE